MSEELLNQEELVSKTQEVAAEAKAAEAPKKKLSGKKILIICAAALVIVGVLLFVFLRKSKFEKVQDEALQIAGMISTGDDYFCLDTFPDSYAKMDEAVVAMLAPMMQENVLEAIRYANGELGFGSDVYDRMMETTALMGSQSAENDKYRVSWTYHPDDGLEVKYEKK